MKTTKIRITKIDENRINWHGPLLERYFKEFLLLRTARKVGDEEVVNNYQLGLLNRCKDFGGIDFEKI